MIVDGHSHCGEEYHSNSKTSIKEYITFASRVGITDAMIMLVPTPMINV